MTRSVVNFLDLETTGLNDPEHRIIEVCSMLCDLETEELLRTFVWRINPMRKIDPKAQKTHGIALADLQNEPTFDVTAPAILGTINTVDLAVAHNGDYFDFPFLTRELARVGQVVRMPKTFDTMTNARWASFNGKNPTLGELCTSLDVPYDPAKAHSASYDVDCMRLCFFEGRRLGFFNP